MSNHNSDGNKYIYLLQEFSIPLLLGVVVALILANVNYPLYERLVYGTYSFISSEEYSPHDGHADDHDKQDHSTDEHAGESTGQTGNESTQSSSTVATSENHGSDEGWKHFATMHFWINEIFMVIFFGVAAKEITESCLPGGDLNPIKKAINPLFGTLGGVFGPIGVYLLLNTLIGDPDWKNGWGIPTATDIALAWLIARMVFGTGHPAISFLLLLAVADDGIGLGIIAFAYPDPHHPTVWANALWIVPGMLIAYGLRRMNVRSWVPYVIFGGGFAWYGLYSAHLHPALALVPIIPFLPGPNRDEGIFRERKGVEERNPLDRFEHDLKLIVDFGLFFFAFANAGVPFANINNLTWIVLLSLIVGKTIGVTLFSTIGTMLGFPLPTGMKFRHLVVAGLVAGLGLTVALFVSGEAFSESVPQGAAKMGALFSAGAALLALALGRVLRVKDGAGSLDDENTPPKPIL